MSRVAILIPTLDRLGGAERQVLLLAKGLAWRNWRVDVIALSGSGEPAREEMSAAGVGFLSLEMRKGLADPRGWWRFHRWLSENSPDIVHAHLPHATWFARWSSLLAPSCMVVDTIHTSAIGTMGRQLGYRLSNWLADGATAVSSAVAEAYFSAGIVSKGRIVVLPNGVDTESWRPDRRVRDAVRRELGLRDEFLWLGAGRLEPVKDYPTLLRAFAAIRKPARLLIAGTGALESSLRQLVSELEIDERVHLIGFSGDVRRWMQAADGFVLSSLWEGLPMSLLEAAACAIPAVATDVAGSREIVVQDQTGFLAAPGDVEGLAGAMARFMEMPNQVRDAMGNCARKMAIERYSLDRVLDRWEALYGELLRERNAVPLRKLLLRA